MSLYCTQHGFYPQENVKVCHFCDLNSSNEKLKELEAKLALAKEALDKAHLLTCDETRVDERCFICEALEKLK